MIRLFVGQTSRTPSTHISRTAYLVSLGLPFRKSHSQYPMAWIIRVLASFLFLSTTVFTIPLAFDVGGRECGLAFSFTLAAFYFLYSLLRLATPDDSRFRRSLVHVVATIQWLAIPTLLIWSLNRYSIDSSSNLSHDGAGWVDRTFNRKRAADQSIQGWLLGRNGLMESIFVGGWDKTLRYSVPLFQLAEGFCTLLVIQAAGQITKWLVNRDGGDNWMVRAQFTGVGLRLT